MLNRFTFIPSVAEIILSVTFITVNGVSHLYLFPLSTRILCSDLMRYFASAGSLEYRAVRIHVWDKIVSISYRNFLQSSESLELRFICFSGA